MSGDWPLVICERAEVADGLLSVGNAHSQGLWVAWCCVAPRCICRRCCACAGARPAIGSNSITFIYTITNAVKHTTYVGRAPHEAFFTPDGKEVWVTVRGENYIGVLDGSSYAEKMRITVPNGPGMTIFSLDGKYGYVCSSFNPETDIVSVADHKIIGKVTQTSPFCPNIAATPDGSQVWFTLKDTGKTQVFDARPPFSVLKILDTGPITNHVNIVRNAHGMFAYITVGGLNEV
jgi:DNA-binding beta-propeller fold protein YncE